MYEGLCEVFEKEVHASEVAVDGYNTSSKTPVNGDFHELKISCESDLMIV